jgi:hypothetical protein
MTPPTLSPVVFMVPSELSANPKRYPYSALRKHIVMQSFLLNTSQCRSRMDAITAGDISWNLHARHGEEGGF